ncbi:LysR family transcriptional regulator [Paraburkholderia susongensis]|uniref:Transcriptional regulator, LysR family n=1 Tax=Paraburkholderia susongensis TaxID=1515439 RepID=A0A1X7HV64_9BURK|nr:LysR family transcriptional regulator [Paraburkholderia susongensis]SMG05886.1 transcriptional regulator, LysR family [Paraburkholderia susongensis]
MPFDERVLNGMGVLTAIVDCGSFAAAGEALDMSQSGVSRSVARLEARLGIRLFDRTTRSVTLTDEGRRFYEQIVPLLGGLEEAAASASQGASAVRGRLRVNMDPFFSRLVLGQRLGGFIEKHHELHLELVTRDQLGDMVEDGFDLAIRFGAPPVSPLVARKLLDTRILTVAAPSYLKKHGQPANPAELESGKHVCIKFRDPITGYPFAWEFHRGRKKLAITPQGRLTINDAGTLHSVCIAGQGIAQILGLGSESLLASGKLVELFSDWRDAVYPLYALYPSRHHPPAKVRAFLDFIVSLTGGAAREASAG